MTEHGEPGGVICTSRQSSPLREIGVQPPTQALVEALGAIDVGHWNDDDLELQIGRGGGADVGGVFMDCLSVLIVTSVFGGEWIRITPRVAWPFSRRALRSLRQAPG